MAAEATQGNPVLEEKWEGQGGEKEITYHRRPENNFWLTCQWWGLACNFATVTVYLLLNFDLSPKRSQDEGGGVVVAGLGKALWKWDRSQALKALVFLKSGNKVARLKKSPNSSPRAVGLPTECLRTKKTAWTCRGRVLLNMWYSSDLRVSRSKSETLEKIIFSWF